MKIMINDSLKITFDKNIEKKSNKKYNLYTLGELFGAYYKNKVFDKEEIVEYLLKNEKEIIKILRNVIGKCYFIFEYSNHIDLYASPSSGGLFYIKKDNQIVISEDELKIYKQSSLDKLDEMEVLNLILSHQALRSPFTTIFSDVKRMIGGQKISIFPNLKIKTDLFMQKSQKELMAYHKNNNFNYDEFEKNFEETLKIIFNNDQKNERYLLYSGGIDSVILLVASLKLGGKILPIHWPISKGQKYIAQNICDKLGCKLEFLNYGGGNIGIDEKKEKISSIFKQGLGRQSYWNSLGFIQKEYFEKINAKRPLVLSGQNFDSLYYINTFAPGQSRIYVLRMLHTLKKLKKRIKYSKHFFDKITKKSDQGLINRYLSDMIVPSFEHTEPLEKQRILPKKLKKIENDYKKFKKLNILSIPLSKEDVDKDLINNNILMNSSIYLNHLVRTIKKIRFTQGAQLSYVNSDKITGANTIMPASEGPLSEFFSSLQLDLYDMLFVKNYSYKYFKKNTGMSYYKISDKTIRKNLKELRNQSKTLKEKEIKDLEIIFPEIISDLYSNIISSCSNKTIKNYVRDIKKQIVTGNYSQCSKSDIMEMDRYVNLETLLNEIDHN